VAPLSSTEAAAEALGDQRRLGRISAYLGASFRLLGEHARSIACGLRALRIATMVEDFALQVAANCYLGETYAVVADYPRAIQHLAWNGEHVAAEQLYESFGASALPAVLSRAFLAQVLADQGAFPEGQLQGSAALTIADAVQQPFSQVIARWGFGHLYLEQGETETAIPLLEQGVEMAERLSITGWAGTLMPTLGYAYAVAGRLGEAIPLLEESLKRLVATRRGHALFTAQLAHAYLGARRGNEASQLAADALSTARRRGERAYEARALHILGEIVGQAAAPHLDIAIRHERDALALAQDLGMRPLAAHCHVSLAKLYRRSAQREQAHEHFATSIMMYRDMDMPFWLKKAEQEIGELA
jgi:tetratricopeptide (TPR) repeat protein